MPSKPIPPGYHTLTPYLTVRGAARAIVFYKQAFGAEERSRLTSLDGTTVYHAEIRTGDSVAMLADESAERGARAPRQPATSPCSFVLYVDDVDQALQRALEAGAGVGSVTDPFGYTWHLSTRIEQISPQEMQQQAAAASTMA